LKVLYIELISISLFQIETIVENGQIINYQLHFSITKSGPKQVAPFSSCLQHLTGWTPWAESAPPTPRPAVTWSQPW